MTSIVTMPTRSRAPIGNVAEASSVRELLDAAAATERLRAAGLEISRAHPEYFRHKEGETSIVSYRFDTPDGGGGARGYARWCVRPQRAEEIHRKALTLRPRRSSVGVSVVRVDDHTVFYGYPNDARLRRLRRFGTDRKLEPALRLLAAPGETVSKTHSTNTVLRYKPERRLVARIELVTSEGSRRPLLLRYTTGRSASRLADTARALRAHGVDTPAPVAQLADGHVGVDDFVDGVELGTWIREKGSVVDALAAALDAFHRTPPPAACPRRAEPEDLTRAVGGLRSLARWSPPLQDQASALTDLLVRHRPEPARVPVLVHGDLHDRNALVRDGGVCFIDLERTAAGSPASDLGRLRAHAISAGIRTSDRSVDAVDPVPVVDAVDHAERVIDRYRSTSGAARRTGDDEVAWYSAIALVDQALVVVRQLEPGWERHAPELLAAAAAELGPSLARRRPAT